jgi:hypothetical protein
MMVNDHLSLLLKFYHILSSLNIRLSDKILINDRCIYHGAFSVQTQILDRTDQDLETDASLSCDELNECLV